MEKVVRFNGKNYIDKLKMRIRLGDYAYSEKIQSDRDYVINIFRANEMTEDIEFYEKWDYGDYDKHLNTKNGRISLHRKGKYVMIEINPLNYDEKDISHDIISRIIKVAKPLHIFKNGKQAKDITILRLDFKQDHLINLGEYTPLTPLRKEHLIKSSGILETRYIGSRESGYMYRIYDKAKEMKIESPIPMWRLEAEIKNDLDIFGWIHSDCDFNPFSKIDLYKKRDYTFSDIEQLEISNAKKCALFTHLNANIPLRKLVGINQVTELNKQKKLLTKTSEKFEINQDISEIKYTLEKLIYECSIDELIEFGKGDTK